MFMPQRQSGGWSGWCHVLQHAYNSGWRTLVAPAAGLHCCEPLHGLVTLLAAAWFSPTCLTCGPPPKQKRRIYDITNVLEGIGLIGKCGKNNVRFTEGACVTAAGACGAGCEEALCWPGGHSCGQWQLF